MPVIHTAALPFKMLPGRASANPLPSVIGDCSVRLVRIAPGPRTPHRHPHSREIVYVAEGTGTAWEAGTRTPVSAGDLLLIEPGVPHATAATGTGLLLVCFFPVGDLAGNLEELAGPIIAP